MGFEDLASLTHEMENVLDLVRNNKLNMDNFIFDTLFKGLDALESMVHDIINGGTGKADVSAIVTSLQAIVKSDYKSGEAPDAPAAIVGDSAQGGVVLDEFRHHLPEDDPGGLGPHLPGPRARHLQGHARRVAPHARAGLRPHHHHRVAPPASTATSARRTTRWRSSASYGFTQTLALEGKKRNVIVNTIAPIAGSRMTETVLPEGAARRAQARVRLARSSPSSRTSRCEETGGLFEVGGGFFAKLRWERTEGKTFQLGRDDHARGRRRRVEGDHRASTRRRTRRDVTESMQPIMANVEAGPSKGGNEFIDVDAALGYKYPAADVELRRARRRRSTRSASAPAQDPTDEDDLAARLRDERQGLEGAAELRRRPGDQHGVRRRPSSGVTAPGLNFGLDRMLHGEQYTEVKRPLPTHGKLTHKAKVKDIFDKGKNARRRHRVHDATTRTATS